MLWVLKRTISLQKNCFNETVNRLNVWDSNYKLIFWFLNQNILYVMGAQKNHLIAKELSQWDSSFSHPKHFFLKMVTIFQSKRLLSYITVKMIFTKSVS